MFRHLSSQVPCRSLPLLPVDEERGGDLCSWGSGQRPGDRLHSYFSVKKTNSQLTRRGASAFKCTHLSSRLLKLMTEDLPHNRKQEGGQHNEWSGLSIGNLELLAVHCYCDIFHISCPRCGGGRGIQVDRSVGVHQDLRNCGHLK